MKTAHVPKPTTPALKRALNLRVDGALADTFAAYCERTRDAISVSRQVENFMISVIKKQGHRHGLKVPSHLAA
jgi:hypothetical protein